MELMLRMRSLGWRWLAGGLLALLETRAEHYSRLSALSEETLRR